MCATNVKGIRYIMKREDPGKRSDPSETSSVFYIVGYPTGFGNMDQVTQIT